MKRALSLFTVVVLLFCCGCSSMKEVVSNSNYVILEVSDGKCLMNFRNPSYFSSDDMQGNQIPPSFVYSSLADMKEVIEKGDFSAKQQEDIQKFFKKQGDSVLVCNTSSLSDARLPEGITSSTIHWYGESYSIDFGDGTVYGCVTITDKNGVDWEESSWGNRTATNKAISIISEETDEERNASVIVFDAVTVGERWKEIRYNYSAGDTNMVILERYLCHESETVPQAIYLWGHSNGEYFTVYIYGIEERPSYKWLTSFGLKPYVETETE